jgi:hypothetical protein
MTLIHDTWADSETPISLELYYSAAWHDITDDVSDSGVSISRGDAISSPAELTCTLDNASGIYSPRHPNSPLYGLVGRNTPIRLRVTVNSVTYDRFTGEVSEWPQRWTDKGVPYTPIRASGVLRRKSQGVSVESVYSRSVKAATDVVGYWPMEDEAGATTFASGLPSRQRSSGLPGGSPMQFRGSPELAANTDAFLCSLPLATTSTDFQAQGSIAPYAPTDEWSVYMLCFIPTASVTGTHRFISITTSADLAWGWQVYINTSGQLYLNIKDSDYTSRDFIGPLSWSLLDTPFRLYLGVSISGSTVSWQLGAYMPNVNLYWQTSGDVTAEIGLVDRVYVPWESFDGATFGHIHVHSAKHDPYYIYTASRGYAHEHVSTRFIRVCSEENIAQWGDTDWVTEYLGPQSPATVVDALAQCRDADGGVIFDLRDDLGLGFRALNTLCDQAPSVTIEYTDNLLLPFEPTEDDSDVRNRLSIERTGGSSATYELTDGPLCTQEPPDGIGLYDASVELPFDCDGSCAPQASWRVNTSCVDEARWPAIGIDLAHPTLRADSDLTADVLGLEIGDRVIITDLPPWLPPGAVDQLLRAYTETITPSRYKITLDCVPYAGYRTGKWQETSASSDYRWSAADSTLDGEHDSTDEELSVDVNAERPWGHGSGDFDILVSGKRFTVTAVAGSTSPQTLTVTPADDGVTKTLPAGSRVTLAAPIRWSLR